jgi:hypothetical protein
VIFSNAAYSLRAARNGRFLDLDHLLSLSLLSAVDTTDGIDETLEVREPRVEGGTIVVERRSTLWERAWLELRCLDTAVEVHTCVSGRGAVTDVRLLGGRSLIAGAPLGAMPTGTSLRRLFSPNPEDLMEPVRDLREGAAIGVLGDGEPGRSRWLFTPAPLYFALGDDDGGWLDLALAAPVDELRFVEAALETYAQSLSLRLDYDGHTHVDGEFRAPVVIVTPKVPDPYRGLRRHRDDLAARGLAPKPEPRPRADWWVQPIFCGWGAQSYLERSGGLARDYATQERYDDFLARLGEQGVRPGIVVLDDKWQATYGANDVDEDKWPDLPGWIARRHADGQRVLLWWKAWDPEGVDPELCVRTTDGTPVALDPGNPATQAFLRAMVHRLLSPQGLDADGFKIDFTARTPTGRALAHSGASWGIALLHDLLAVVYAAAKEAKADALVMTHTPHPSFADVTDMIRLNDMLTGEIVPQMTFRADVVRAALPEVPIDTDDWRIHDKRSWREFLEVKPELGVPSLYYSTHIDATGEELGDDDYAALRRVWAAWKERVR